MSVTQEKWEHARGYLYQMQETLDKDNLFDFKMLEKQRGFLVYLACTYPALTPFLKGIRLMVDSWQSNRDSDGWKLSGELAAHTEDEIPQTYDMHPDKVQGVPRLRSDISSLLSLFSAAQPPHRIIRSSHLLAVYYGCGDASGGGFGSTFTGSGGIEYTYGVWGDDLAGCLSNFRELFNLTESLEDKVSTLSFGHLTHLVSSLESQVALYPACEIYLFTDNAVAEGAFHRGTSSNCRLFDLVLRLKQLELHHGAQLHVIHISGTRMQAQGTDALSWGDLTTGVMCNRDMLQFIPLHLSALDRSPPNTSDTSPLARLWTPPPAVADVALEQLSYSRHKHPDLLHIFICPRLMTH